MPTPTFIILYVADPSASARFYAGILDRAPVESSSEFAMFALDTGTMLGLWARDAVKPATDPSTGGAEVGLPADSAAAVDTRHADWIKRGLPILQAPTSMDFGRTFVASDPDGHRLRVFAPAAK